MHAKMMGEHNGQVQSALQVAAVPDAFEMCHVAFPAYRPNLGDERNSSVETDGVGLVH